MIIIIILWLLLLFPLRWLSLLPSSTCGFSSTSPPAPPSPSAAASKE